MWWSYLSINLVVFDIVESYFSVFVFSARNYFSQWIYDIWICVFTFDVGKIAKKLPVSQWVFLASEILISRWESQWDLSEISASFWPVRLQRIGKISVKILQGLSNYLIPIRLIKSLCKCGTISVEGLIRWLWMKLTPYFYREYITHDKSQFYSKITYNCKEINLNKKFWSWCNNRNIISTFIKNLIFMKEINCHSTSSKTDAKTN